MINPIDMPVYFSWIQYLSHVTWAFQSLVTVVFQGYWFLLLLVRVCSHVLLLRSASLTCTDSELRGGFCPMTTGQDLINSFNFMNEVCHTTSYCALNR